LGDYPGLRRSRGRPPRARLLGRKQLPARSSARRHQVNRLVEARIPSCAATPARSAFSSAVSCSNCLLSVMYQPLVRAVRRTSRFRLLALRIASASVCIAATTVAPAVTWRCPAPDRLALRRDLASPPAEAIAPAPPVPPRSGHRRRAGSARTSHRRCAAKSWAHREWRA
jgi:hypothetical protein